MFSNKIKNIFEIIYNKLISQGFKRYFSHVSWNISGRIINTLISFFINIFVVRYLGPEKYGFLSYAMSFAGLFSFLASLGVENLLYFDLIKYPERKNKLLGTSFVLKIFGSFLSFISLLIAIFFANNSLNLNIAILIFGLSYFFQSFNIINIYFQSKVLSRPTVLLSIFSNIILSILKIIFVLFQYNVFYFVSIYLIESIILMFGNIYIYKKENLKILNWEFDFSLAKNILFRAWPLILSSASVFIYSRIDQIFIKHLIDQSSVGIYDVGVRFAESWYALPLIIVGSLYPAIINAGKINVDFHNQRLIKLYSFLFYVSIIFILPIYLFSNDIIKLLYGEQFISAAIVLKIYIWSGIGISLGTIINQYLIAQNHTKTSFILNLVNMSTNVILNLLFIPKYGIKGAAFATLISYSIFPFTIIFHKKSRHQLFLIYKAITFKGILYE